MAMDANLAVEAVQGSLTPGWLFPVRAEAVIEKLKAALAAGVHPSRLHDVLASANGHEGVAQSVLQAAHMQLGPLVDKPRVRPLRQPLPVGQSWRQLAGLARESDGSGKVVSVAYVMHNAVIFCLKTV